jgi:hypothetical protein
MTTLRMALVGILAWIFRKTLPLPSTPPESYNPPMSDDKFRIIDAEKVGSLDETMRTEWERLHQAELRITRLQEEHDQACDAFWDAVQRQFGHRLEEGPGVTKELKIDDDGDVFVEHCACPICQASLHGVTVTEAVEQMYKNDLIPHQAIDTMRAKAKHIDSHQEMRKKMLN